jgi:site-specific DNA recombinase
MAGRKSKYQQDYQSNKRARKTWVVAKYIRLSKEDEDIKDESNSVTSQNTILDEFVERNQNDNEEFVVYDTYVDDGYSGTDFDRPDFQRLLEDMKAGKFNTIIIKDLSRLGRNYIEAGNFIEQIFPLFKIRFISISEDIDSVKKPTSVNNVLVPFKNLMNDEYCRDISTKILMANNARKRNGQYLGSFPIYRIYQRSRE